MKPSLFRHPLFLLVAIPGVALIPHAACADNWPAWRGALGQGQCLETGLPMKWSPSQGVRWKAPLPGPGNSTPIIWGDRIFLTQATDKGQKRSLWCLDRHDGKKLWERTIAYGEKEPTHETNPACSASPVTDGERVVVSHGSAGLACYDFAGELLWKRDLGKCEHIWGTGASPVLYRDLVILSFGPGERTFLVAINKKTGKDAWKVDEAGGRRGDKGQTEWIGSWSTPIVATIGSRDELLMSWPGAIKSYDPATGKLLWTCRGLEKDDGPDRLVYTSPLVAGETVIAMSGYGGPPMAARAGGEGDVTATHRLWRGGRSPQRIGTGAIVGDYLYLVNEPGTAQCIEWKTGKTLWTERACGSSWGSLVHADGKLFVTSLAGETVILAAKPKFELLERNHLKERTLASIAVSDGCLFIRTYQHLWCIGP